MDTWPAWTTEKEETVTVAAVVVAVTGAVTVAVARVCVVDPTTVAVTVTVLETKGWLGEA